jgi:hypothetical protein
MAIRALNIEASRKVQSKLDPDYGKDEASTFEVGTLDSRISGMLRDKATTVSVNPSALEEEVDTSINMSEVNFLTCMYGIRGWKNVKDRQGNELAFKTLSRMHGGKSYRVVDAELLKLIPQAVIEELAAEIKKDNEVTEPERKN